MNKALVVILAAVMLDAIGIGLIFPILPALLREVGHVDDISLLLGVMLALYSACQFLFSPVLGVLSDRFGRRPVLLVSLAGAAIDYVIMAFAPHLWLLVLGRAIAGVTSANMAVATAYITDITTEEERAQRFGLFHAMFGVGFIIGVIQDSVETCLNSASDVEFAATAEYHAWLKQGRQLPAFMYSKKERAKLGIEA